MAGRPSNRPDKSKVGGRFAWARHLVEPPVSQDELADAMGYKNQSGVSELEKRDGCPPRKAKAGAQLLAARTGYAITSEWLLHGGADPQRSTTLELVSPVQRQRIAPDDPEVREIYDMWHTLFEDQRAELLAKVRDAFALAQRIHAEMNRRGYVRKNNPNGAIPPDAFTAPPQGSLIADEPTKRKVRGR